MVEIRPRSAGTGWHARSTPCHSLLYTVYALPVKYISVTPRKATWNPTLLTFHLCLRSQNRKKKVMLLMEIYYYYYCQNRGNSKHFQYDSSKMSRSSRPWQLWETSSKCCHVLELPKKEGSREHNETGKVVPTKSVPLSHCVSGEEHECQL